MFLRKKTRSKGVAENVFGCKKGNVATEDAGVKTPK